MKNKLKSKQWAYVGGLSKPGKMPCFGYSLPAAECKVGGSLRDIEGSVCHGCYAHRGNYLYPSVDDALYRRLKSITKIKWVDCMVALLEGERHFRWHDAGDIQSAKHLLDIFEVCDRTPTTSHWLPTREYKFVEQALKKRKVPENMCLRLSGHMINESGPVVLAKRLGVQMSEVFKEGYTCPASTQNNKCQDCRACWDKNNFNIIYKKH